VKEDAVLAVTVTDVKVVVTNVVVEDTSNVIVAVDAADLEVLAKTQEDTDHLADLWTEEEEAQASAIAIHLAVEVEEVEAEHHQDNTTVITRTMIARDPLILEVTAEAQSTVTIRTDTTCQMEIEFSRVIMIREKPTPHVVVQDHQYHPITNT